MSPKNGQNIAPPYRAPGQKWRGRDMSRGRDRGTEIFSYRAPEKTQVKHRIQHTGDKWGQIFRKKYYV